MEKPTILHLITSFKLGGAEKFLANILPALNDFKHIAVSLGSATELSQALQTQGITCYNLNSGKYFSPKAILSFYKIIKQHQPKILITYLIHADIFGRIFGRLFAKAKIICFLRSSLDAPKYRLFFLAERLTSCLVDKYFAVSKTTKKIYMVKAGINGNKIIVIPNGIKLENFPLIPTQPLKVELNLPSSALLIGTVSRLVMEKNTNLLISAFFKVSQNFPNAFLVICGDGPEKNKLIELSKRYNIEQKIFFLGFRSDISKILSSLDIYCQLSAFEGMSNSILEALISGCPLLISDIEANLEICENEKNGLLVNIAKPEILVSKLTTLITDSSLRNKLHNHNLALRSKFSFENTINLLNNEINKL